MSDSDFFSQLAQMGTVQGVQQIEQSSQVSQAASLMGQTVSGVAINTSSGTSSIVTGTVQGVTVQNGSYMLNVVDSSGNTSQININNITSIQGGSQKGS
jgi:hypothetical protein